MRSSIFLICAIISLILASKHNAQGSAPKMRAKRMTKSTSDVNNEIKHEIRLTIGNRLCSGTIIDDEHILTAAHCVAVTNTNKIIDIDSGLIEVTAGITNVYDSFEFHIVRLVEKIYVPRYFNNSIDTQKAIDEMIGDIAVLKLNYKLGLELDSKIEALKLPTSENYDNNIMFSGFGSTKVFYNNSTREYEQTGFPEFLQYSRAEVFQAERCVKVRNATLQMCARVNDNGGICGGDSGGGLFNVKDKTIIGVLSTGPTSCTRYAATYTKVFPYKQFITNAINNFTDDMARIKSYEKHHKYRNALRRNPWKYYWIYIPEETDDQFIRFSV